jgi:hypothetical protein
MKGLPFRKENFRNGNAAALRVLGVFSVLAFAACGNLVSDNPPSSNGGFRRTYTNDSAAADSLTAGIVRNGIKFVLQPGKDYQLSILTKRTNDHLSVFYYSTSDGVQGQYQSLAAKSDGTHELFPLVSNRLAAQFYVAQLSVSDGLKAIADLGHVSLVSQNVTITDTLHIRLIFIKTLSGLPTAASKAAFADSLFASMAAIYRPLGILLQGSYEIVQPDAAAEDFPFGNSFVPLQGTRITNNAHLYLVEKISVTDPASGLVGEVLGFAPREVVDLDQDRESRVILANRAGSIPRLAITATHELGHFFGLRHTVSTKHDLLQDGDSSNIEDGFTDTKFCDLDLPLAKRASAPEWNPKIGGTVYCLRMADNSCDASICDLKNLMHPVDCGRLDQIVVSPQQAAFLKKNLATYRH